MDRVLGRILSSASVVSQDHVLPLKDNLRMFPVLTNILDSFSRQCGFNYLVWLLGNSFDQSGNV